PLVLAAVLLGAAKLLIADLVARGKNGDRAVAALLGLVVMVAADLALIPAFGIVGAALGSVLGYGASAIYAARAWRAATGEPLRELVGIRRDDLRVLRQAVARRRHTLPVAANDDVLSEGGEEHAFATAARRGWDVVCPAHFDASGTRSHSLRAVPTPGRFLLEWVLLPDRPVPMPFRDRVQKWRLPEVAE